MTTSERNLSTMDATGFIENFHSISGRLLKDRNKSFRLLLVKYSALKDDENTVKEIIEKLNPKTYLEETYKLEFLIYFKRASELLDLLKNGNNIATSKIIKQTWFISAILKDLSPEQFVRDVFPQLSLIVRLKILKQILKQIKEEEFINSLYDELNHVYGYSFASVLIPGCSVSKIKEFLNERGFKISLAQLKLLHDKDRSLIRFYYEELHKMGGDLSSLNSFSRYLSKKDADLFIELVIRYKIRTYYGLGQQSTKLFVKNNKESLLEDPMKYLELNVLKKSALVRQLGKIGKDCSSLFKASFPETWRELTNSSDIFNLLREYPKRRRYDVFSKLFNEVYNTDLFKVKELIKEELLEAIPSHEEREKWVEVFKNDLKYIKYKRSSESVPQLKEMLLRADNVAFRKELLEYIVIACSISEDYERLLEILKLVCKRFRNTDDGALYTFLDKIQEKIELKKLEKEHWECIHEIILLQDLRNISMNAEIIFEYCKFLFKCGKPFEKMIPLFLKCSIHLPTFKFVDEDFRNNKFRKIFLQHVLKHYASLDEKYRSCSKCIGIVMAVKHWNKKHPQELLMASNVDAIIQKVQNELKNSWIYYDSEEIHALKYLLCFENARNHFESIYFENINNLANYSITKWFLKYEPEIFQKYIENTYSCFVARGKYLMRVLRKLEYSGITANIEEHYIKKLTEPEQDDRDKFAQLIASTIPAENYLRLIEKYVPKTDKLEVCNASQEDKTLLQVEIALAKSVRFSASHQKALKILFQYCKGDLLQPSLFSLYSCFMRINEESLKPYISLLMDKPVSLRKHSIFLAALVFPIEVNVQLGESMMKKEKDISVRKHLFTSTYKYFLKNPTDQFWKMLENHMRTITVHDKESLKLIAEIHDFPQKFRGRFAQTVWQTIENLEREEKKSLSQYYNDLFTNIRDIDLKLLSPKFCIEIIEKKLFEEGHKKNAICSKFAIQFMMYSEDIRLAVGSVMKIFNEYKTKYWKTNKSAHAKSVVYHFCYEIFDTAMSKDYLRINVPIEFVHILKEEWKKVFKREETFEEYLLLDFMILKYENDNNIPIFAQYVSEQLEYSRNEYGEQVLILFRDFLETSLIKLLGDKKYNTKLMEFLKHLIEQGPTSQIKYLLIIQLLPIGIKNEKSKKNYDFVLKKISDITSPIISISLNKRFKQ